MVNGGPSGVRIAVFWYIFLALGYQDTAQCIQWALAQFTVSSLSSKGFLCAFVCLFFKEWNLSSTNELLKPLLRVIAHVSPVLNVDPSPSLEGTQECHAACKRKVNKVRSPLLANTLVPGSLRCQPGLVLAGLRLRMATRRRLSRTFPLPHGVAAVLKGGWQNRCPHTPQCLSTVPLEVRASGPESKRVREGLTENSCLARRMVLGGGGGFLMRLWPGFLTSHIEKFK